MFRTFTAALVLVLGMSVVPAMAADASTNSAIRAAAGANDFASDTDWALPAVNVGTAPSTRGGLLPALYVSLTSLNVYDAYSTKAGLAHGAVEANPAMTSVAGNSALFLGLKGVATASTILVAEHLWKTHHRGQAIALMVVSNGMMAAVAAHNASVLGGQR